MAEFKNKNSNNFWHSPLILFVLFCILVLFSYNIIGLFEKERDTAKKKELILAQIEALRNREESLNKDIEKLQTSAGVEETIRDKFQVVKEGEKMLVIVDNENRVTTQKTESLGAHSFWGWIKRTFGIN